MCINDFVLTNMYLVDCNGVTQDLTPFVPKDTIGDNTHEETLTNYQSEGEGSDTKNRTKDKII